MPSSLQSSEESPSRALNHSAEYIRENQLRALNELLEAILPSNAFYTKKILAAGNSKYFSNLRDFSEKFPFTTKDELVQDQQEHLPYGRNLTYPLEKYCRLHATSGTTGKPLRWLDTPESWEMLLQCWMEVYNAASVTKKDIVFFAFSFGPFLGFWTAFEAATRLGALCIPGGGLSTLARLKVILENKATVVCCTPTYAIHLGETAHSERLDLSKSAVRRIIVAGEPGGSLPATREHIERLWPGAQVFDHHGLTETGPITYECPVHPCRLHVVDWAYFIEVIDRSSNLPVKPGQDGELVVTTLKRTGSPLLRYKTGDVVRLALHHKEGKPCECGRYETALEGGIIGRTDDMVVIRGVNIYPTAIEAVVRKFPEIAEYQVKISRRGSMQEIHLLIEPVQNCKDVTALVVSAEKALQTAFNLRIPVTIAPAALPRSELKAKRWLVA
jgi:phenylacetate-CoA ligase